MCAVLIVAAVVTVTCPQPLTASRAAAAAIVAPHQFVAPRPADGPLVVVVGSPAATGPWGWPAPLPERRLDGRRWMDPDVIYGQPWPFLPPGAYPAWVGAPWRPAHVRPRPPKHPSAPPQGPPLPPRHVTNGPPASAGGRAR